MQALENRTFDAIVVGSGPGGAAVTHEMNRLGKRVLVLERGTGEAIKGTILQSASIALIPGQSLLCTPQLLTLVRGIVYGGSSIVYYACAFDPPYAMFDSYGIDLRSTVEEVRKELPIAPLADNLMGPAARRIMESAQSLGYAWNKLPKMVHQERCRPGCDKCTLGCPYGAKWTSREYIDAAMGKGTMLLTGARVERIVTRAGSSPVVRFTIGGQPRQVAAPAVVLAAGGIGTPFILRDSGISGAGHDFFFDPLIVAMGEVDGIECSKEFPMAAGYNDEGEGYIMTDLVWPRLIYQLFTAQVLRFDRLTAHARTLPIMIKARDGLGGRLTKRGYISKPLDAKDRRKLLRGYARAKGILKNAGARNIFKTWFIATHPGGTAKIGDIVDHNLKTGLSGVYVCDCSVIPEPWGLPPTLTLLALGKRLGRHLAAEAGLF